MFFFAGFPFVPSCSGFFMAVVRRFYVLHGSNLIFKTFISCLPMIFDGLVLLPLVAACCNLQRCLIAVGRFISFRVVLRRLGCFTMFVLVLACLGSIHFLSLYLVFWVRYFDFHCVHLFQDVFLRCVGDLFCFLSEIFEFVLHRFRRVFRSFKFCGYVSDLEVVSNCSYQFRCSSLCSLFLLV